jgi:hypothetical protein
MSSLHTPDTAVVGTLYANVTFDASLKDSNQIPQPPLMCELVEISRAYKDTIPHYSESWSDWECSRIRELGRYEFHNVLCIWWESGVAYRCGVGQVESTAWGSTEREWIDLLLG